MSIWRKHIFELVFVCERSIYGTDITCIKNWDVIDSIYTYKSEGHVPEIPKGLYVANSTVWGELIGCVLYNLL